MRRSILIVGFALATCLALFYALGGYDALHRVIESSQRQMQSTLAGAVRHLRAGDPGARAALMAACFSYGFIHAAGPGHGKVLIAGYGVGQRVPVLRLAILALASSLAQSLVAIGLVVVGIAILGWTREQMVGVTEDVMRPISYGAILLLGLWLVWRGVARLLRQGHAAKGHHDHVHDEHCGHAHGPTMDDAARVTSLRDGLGLIAGIAMRPCTGALFLLILTWAMGIFASGVAGVLAMGAGTASVTVGVAMFAVWAREGALASLPGGRIAAALPVLELGAGLVVALVAAQLLISSL
jgi:nickel/cobalt transporter (NicO) family protein